MVRGFRKNKTFNANWRKIILRLRIDFLTLDAQVLRDKKPTTGWGKKKKKL